MDHNTLARVTYSYNIRTTVINIALVDYPMRMH